MDARESAMDASFDSDSTMNPANPDDPIDTTKTFKSCQSRITAADVTVIDGIRTELSSNPPALTQIQDTLQMELNSVRWQEVLVGGVRVWETQVSYTEADRIDCMDEKQREEMEMDNIFWETIGVKEREYEDEDEDEDESRDESEDESEEDEEEDEYEEDEQNYEQVEERNGEQNGRQNWGMDWVLEMNRRRWEMGITQLGGQTQLYRDMALSSIPEMDPQRIDVPEIDTTETDLPEFDAMETDAMHTRSSEQDFAGLFVPSVSNLLEPELGILGDNPWDIWPDENQLN